VKTRSANTVRSRQFDRRFASQVPKSSTPPSVKTFGRDGEKKTVYNANVALHARPVSEVNAVWFFVPRRVSRLLQALLIIACSSAFYNAALFLSWKWKRDSIPWKYQRLNVRYWKGLRKPTFFNKQHTGRYCTNFTVFE